MHAFRQTRVFAGFFAALVMASSLLAANAHADMMSTQDAIADYDRAALTDLLQTQEAQEQLVALGADPERVAERVAHLTDAELAQFNAQLEEGAAGGNAAGVVLTVFIVFVITDMLCATDLFSFVKCIN